VFKLEWYQPLGHNTNPAAILAEPPPETSTDYNKSHRRMLVVQEHATHCLVVYATLAELANGQKQLMLASPISTYGQRGCLKDGMRETEIRHHAVIHSSSREAWWDREETARGMRLGPIPVELVGRQTLDRWSRVRFDNVHTVTHNFKVMNIGMVPRGYHPTILTNLNESLFPSAGPSHNPRRRT